MTARLATALVAALAVGCVERDLSHVDLTVSGVHAERRTGSGGFLGLDLLLTDASGAPIPCGEGRMDLEVEVAPVGSERFTALSGGQLTWRCNGPRTADVAIVADNSKSAEEYLSQIQDGARALADQVLDDGGRVSLVRVETEAHKLLPLSDDRAAVHAAIDGLFVTRGWSALYDGLRMGNETLGGDVRSALDAARHDDVDAFCDNSRTVAIAAFTDGDDNNSAGQSQTAQSLIWYPGDGIDTTFDDVLNLRVDDITTPVYTVGLGYWFEDELMTELAHKTGGRYLQIDEPEQIAGALAQVGTYLESTHQVCAELPERECGDYTVRVRAEWTGASASASGEFEHLVHLPCDVEPAGRTATVLLTMTTSGLTEAQASTLARNAVGWASPVLRPRVLVVLDDGHHNERPGDAAAVHGWLLDAEAVDRADYLEEPSGGLDAAALEAYDVVWFSNPGYPMDDRASFDALLAFSEAGGGVVLQGDDISWSWANGWSMAPLTRTRWVDNGVRECDQLVNNHRHGQYEVRLAGDPHDLTAGLPATFRYGDDIDYTEPIGDDATVLAWANLPAGACRADRPVLLAHDPGSHP